MIAYRIIERVGKEVAVVCFKIISRNLLAGTDKNNGNIRVSDVHVEIRTENLHP
jgi:hypothetical protein